VIPKVDGSMFRKELLKDWSSSHLLDCDWYLDYPKDCISSSEIALYKKIDPRFQYGL
jgi:hypothetical protein